MVERCWNAEVTGSIPVLFLFYSRLANANFSYSIMEECLLKIERRIYYELSEENRRTVCFLRIDGIRVFIESNQKVMYIDTGEYKNAQSARAAYANAIALIRAKGIVRPACNRNDLFLIRNDI